MAWVVTVATLDAHACALPWSSAVGEFATLTPGTGPICGGTNMTVTLKDPDAPFLFDDAGKAHVRITGPDFQQVRAGGSEARSHGIEA